MDVQRAGAFFLSIAILAILASGCSTMPGVFNGLGEDPMPMIKIVKSDFDPRTGENPITAAQYAAVQDLAEALKMQIDWQTSTTAEAMISNGVPFGMAGAGGGASTGLLYPGAAALAGPAAGVTGLVYGFGGAVNGAITHSYSNVYAIGDMLEKAMRDWERKRGKKYRAKDSSSLFKNLHAVGSFTRSRNSKDSPAPGLAKKMPDWHGPVSSGDPAKR